MMHLLNGTQWTVIGTGFAVILAILGGGARLWRTVEKDDPKFVKELPPKVVEAADEGAALIEGLENSPLFASLVGQGNLKAEHVLSHILDTHLALAAQKAVGTFNGALNVAMGALSATQKTDIIEFVRGLLATQNHQVTDAQIVAALQDAQRAYDFITQTVIPEVQKHDAQVKAWNQSVTPSETSATTETHPIASAQ